MPPLVTTTNNDSLRDKILHHLCLGDSMTHTAKLLGVSVKVVSRIRDQEFKDKFAGREALKLQTAMELDWLVRPLKDRYATDPNRDDALAILKILDRKAKLFALDEAVKVQVTHVEEMNDDELRAELARHGIEYKQLPAAKVADEDEVVDVDYTVSKVES